MRPLLIARLALVPLALLECGIVYFFATCLPPSPPTYSVKRIAFLVLYLTAVPGALPDRSDDNTGHTISDLHGAEYEK